MVWVHFAIFHQHVTKTSIPIFILWYHWFTIEYPPNIAREWDSCVCITIVIMLFIEANLPGCVSNPWKNYIMLNLMFIIFHSTLCFWNLWVFISTHLLYLFSFLHGNILYTDSSLHLWWPFSYRRNLSPMIL